jgi:peptidoglycan/LPS O-acetylase OafA/YrhL
MHNNTIELSIVSHPKALVKVYFENLNAIRFIAAFLVVIHHIEALKTRIPIPNYWDNKIILLIGRLGVILFFVLSGFLISFLLFKEQEVTKILTLKIST